FLVVGFLVFILIEQADSLCAFPRLDDELDCTRVEPFLPLVDPGGERSVGEPAVVLLPEPHPNIEAAAACRGYVLRWIEFALRETLTAFDSTDSDVRAQIQ